MAAPQVAGLAAYVWALDPTLPVADVIKILVTTASTPDNDPPVIDAYAAVLAVDNPPQPDGTYPSGNLALAKIRRAILDRDGDSTFNLDDIKAYKEAWTASQGIYDYSEYDLNGDGLTGGEERERFNLDLGDPSKLGVLDKTIEGEMQQFDETQLKDRDILCYYAYSELYQGDPGGCGRYEELLGVCPGTPPCPSGCCCLDTTATHQEAYIKASNTGIDDWFGAHVAIDGNTMVIGAPGEDSNGAVADNSEPSSGAAYVFDRGASGTWVQTAYLKGTIGSGDVFGSSVAIEGDTIVVGAPAEDSDDDSILNVGNAYIFERVVGIWTQTADLQAPAVQGANFGWSVAVAGDHVVVGAPFERSTFTNGGAVHVFNRSDDGWGLARSIKGSNTGGGDEFGASVAISGNTLVVGAAGEDSPSIGVNGEEIDDVFFAQSGAVYVFEGSGAAWSQTTYVKASNTGHSDRFGHSVAIDGDILAVSAPFEDSPATGVNSPEQGDDPLSTHSGAVYVFERSDGGTWSQTAYVKASNAGGSDLFGGIGGPFRSFGKNAVASIALSGNALLVGASAEDSAATGIDCDDSNDNDNAGQSGAAYLFELIGDAWVQTLYIKASNTGDRGNRFGGSVALDGSLGVVGAFSENSAASGVGGDQSDSSAGNNSGAAYVFVLTP